jgi:putative DNA primase/helicase
MRRAAERDVDLLRFYDNEGIKLVRLSAKTKKCVDAEWQLKEIALEDIAEWVRQGGDVGWQCGEVSRWIAAADLDCREVRQLAPRFLPDTLLGAKGEEAPSQYFYRSVGLGFKKFTDLDGSEMASIKASNNGAGHQVAVAPSVHREKGTYRFVGGYNPAAIAEVGQEVLRKRMGMLVATALVARHLPAAREEGGGGRHDVALALAGYMLRNGEAEDAVEQMLVAAWELREAPRYAVEDVRRCVRDTAVRLARNEPTTGGRRLEELLPGVPDKIADFLAWDRADKRELRRHYTRSDLGNAERFVDMFGDRVRWCPARKAWLVYDGKRWAWDDRGRVVKLAQEAARGLYKEALLEPDPAKQKGLTKFAIGSQNEGRISGMLSQAKPHVAVGLEDLDADPWVLNCQNGTLDLKSGKLKAHHAGDHITKIVPVEYDPTADCPRFHKFLAETLIDSAVVAFVKRYSGYTLTGVTRERLFAILWGSGKNGKTTLVELLHDALGDYARNTDVETILARKYAGVGNDVAALKGARFVSCAEVEHGRRLAESKVKTLTGTDTVTARFLFGEPFDFRPQFKLWLSTNNRPTILGTDDAIWDRIRLIPFTQRFDGNRQDPKLPEKLRAELPGVLAWMVEGCLEWQEHGLGEAEKVRVATDRYRAEMDTLASFLADRCVVREGLSVRAEVLYQQYSMWCEDNGERKEAQKGFVGRLSDRGFQRERETRGVNRGRYVWRGLGLRDEGDGPDPGDGGSQREPSGPVGSHYQSGIHKQEPPPAPEGREPSEAANQNLQRQNPRDVGVLEKGFTGFTGFTGSMDEDVKAVSELFSNPPGWFVCQVETHLAAPTDGKLAAICAAVANEVLGNPRRRDEVRAAVERALERWGR